MARMKTSEIQSAIEKKVKIEHIDIQNPRGDGLHFEALVVSSEFEGLSLIDRHRKVMDVLKDYFKTALHALSLKTLTPTEWNKND